MILTVCRSCRVIDYKIGIDRCTYCGSLNTETKFVPSELIKRDVVMGRDILMHPGKSRYEREKFT